MIKKKICLLGNFERYKDEFQKFMSSDCLPIKNKEYLGVNISKINFIHRSRLNFEFFLWNIDCGQYRAFLRPNFYAGAEAIIVFLSEMSVNQILQYLNEIRLRTPLITIIFCIILENQEIEDIIESYFRNEDFQQVFNNDRFEFRAITDPVKIFNQICSSSLKNVNNNTVDDRFIINFISLDVLINQDNGSTQDEYNDYFEPDLNDIKIKHRINTQILCNYLKNMGLDFKEAFPQWFKVKSEKYGTFSLNLKNGKVYLFPKTCEICMNGNCVKFKKAPYFICIETETKSEGWSNIDGLDDKELLVISIILSLRDDNFELPEEIIKQIKKVSKCIK